MKAIIERSLEINEEDIVEKWTSFNKLLRCIEYAGSEAELRKYIKSFNDFPTNARYFKIGFGSNHMWAHELCRTDRLLIVEF